MYGTAVVGPRAELSGDDTVSGRFRPDKPRSSLDPAKFGRESYGDSVDAHQEMSSGLSRARTVVPFRIATP
jgi:hypothetical protein